MYPVIITMHKTHEDKFHVADKKIYHGYSGSKLIVISISVGLLSYNYFLILILKQIHV